MKNIEQVNKVTSNIIECKGNIDAVYLKIEGIESGKDFAAELNLEISNNKRSVQRFFLNKGEVLSVLKTRLYAYKTELIEFEKQYTQLQ